MDAEPAYDAGFKPGAWKVKLSGLEFREDKLVIPVTLHLPQTNSLERIGISRSLSCLQVGNAPQIY